MITVDEAIERLVDAQAEVIRLREALAFYALSVNWDLQAPESEQPPVGLDGGDRARQALQSKEG